MSYCLNHRHPIDGWAIVNAFDDSATIQNLTVPVDAGDEDEDGFVNLDLILVIDREKDQFIIVRDDQTMLHIRCTDDSITLLPTNVVLDLCDVAPA